MAVAAVSISPLGEGTSVSEYVARTLEVLDARDDVHYEIGPMFTTIEGDPDVIFEVVRDMQEAMFAMGSDRVTTILKMDDRRDEEHGMQRKMRSAREEMR